MKNAHRPVRTLIASSLIVSLLGLSACNKSGDSSAAAAASDASVAAAAQPASTPVAYTPPTADQLYQMVAPIALFPDKLVALVLAGATYPDQVTAANNWVTQNPSLKGQALATAADTQPWDPSIKALTAFPAVLSQMASNPAWTTSLGQAYYNDPTDVMNAIQVMRQRAQTSGHLRSGGQLRVTQVAQAAPSGYTPAADAPVLYTGPAIVPPPVQAIEIESAQPDLVYVPSYNPTVVYGEPVSAYPGYVYRAPAYSTGEVVAAGVITFGVGIAVGAAIFGHHDWGWHAWGMNWGAPRPEGPGWNGGWQRPAVVYNHTTYVTKSTTVINNITNIRNTRITNNYGGNVTNNTTNTTIERNTVQPGAEAMRGQAAEQRPGAAPMSMPHFTANDTRPGARPTPDAFAQNRANEPRAEAPAQHAPGATQEARQQAMQQERAAQENRAIAQQEQQQQQQQRNEAMQQREAAQQRNEQQQREEAQQRNAAQQQREEVQQRNAAQQQQHEAMQQRNEAQPPMHKEAPPRNEAQPQEHAQPPRQPASEHEPAPHPRPAEPHPEHEAQHEPHENHAE
ncbi:hypothetical protein GQ57_24210 [Burkholderia sp. MSh2]|uniref:DUF3300 domain-containing protein n=1 Tax=Burkholderia paludis TaxID=1506587 RepID=A0A6J5DAM1_9BURK|nr:MULTISPECIES: DUF3300 domain-containing protein [Burkholderia]KEZ03408.1 hypothetical protein GQ57_24210 [Burkholderia sp. MSh2]CAB3751320.1 hypothetical protein LMG30113_01435 [Burkholderia paludis]VWB07601.1 hypothetical protein BPA30113_00043 [Burkholderia paludis]